MNNLDSRLAVSHQRESERAKKISGSDTCARSFSVHIDGQEARWKTGGPFARCGVVHSKKRLMALIFERNWPDLGQMAAA
jgi:hypothetical protein